MAYIDILPLATMKTYLRIDDTQNETDAEITSMINSAFRHIEKSTNIIVSRQATKEYIITNNYVRVYDFPINDVVKGIDDDGDDVALTYKTNYYKSEKHLYTLYHGIDSDAVKLVLDVGYVDEGDVPDDLVTLAKEIVKAMYYEEETDKSFHEMLSPLANWILEQNRRHLI